MDLSEIIVPDGLQPKPMVTCVVEGLLDEDDLRELALSSANTETSVARDDDPTDLKKIREKHHSVARMIAGGLNQRMVSQLCGYSETYLSVLLNNPAMQELIELYRIQAGAGQKIITEKLLTVGLKALEELDQAIETGQLTKQELIQTAKLGLDRAGRGPQSTQHVVNETHIFDHAELVQRNQAARDRSAARIVPSQEVRAALAPPTPKPEQNVETDQPVGPQEPEFPQDRQQ